MPLIRSELARRLLQETVVVGFFLWAFLYVADIVKPGFASNYLSLPKLAVVLFALAIVVAAAQPPKQESSSRPPAASWSVFAVLAVLVVVSLLAAGLSVWLTLALAFVTLFSLWALGYGWQDNL